VNAGDEDRKSKILFVLSKLIHFFFQVFSLKQKMSTYIPKAITKEIGKDRKKDMTKPIQM
jgi:hypothetical protein